MTHPAYSKFYIQKEDQPASGPFHWKRIVEWYEFGLLDDYVLQKPNDELAPIADLVGAYGVPPTIAIQSMLLAPSESVAKCTQEQRTALGTQGFPEISVPLTQELADYIGKRLACSDKDLEAEDPNFKSPNPLGLLAPAQELEATSNDPATGDDPADVSEPVSEASESDAPEAATTEADATDVSLESTAAEEITQDATVAKEPTLEVDEAAESIEEVSDSVLESSAEPQVPEPVEEAPEPVEEAPEPVEEAPEPVEEAPAEVTPPTAMSFEELADSTPEVQPVQNRWSDNSNSNRKRILVSLSAIAAILVVVGTVFYVSNSSSTDSGQITPVALEAEAPIEMESETLSETLTETSSDIVSAPDTSESAASVVASSEVEEVAESRLTEEESEPVEEPMPTEAAALATDSPEEVATNSVEASTNSSTETVAEKDSAEQADQPSVAASDDSVTDIEVSSSMKLPAQEVKDNTTRLDAQDTNNASEPLKLVDEVSKEAVTTQEKQPEAPTAPLEEFPDYIPSF